jgi:chromosomal replication initiation ATPase DnaA
LVRKKVRLQKRAFLRTKESDVISLSRRTVFSKKKPTRGRRPRPQAGSGKHMMEQRTANRQLRLSGRQHELATLWSQFEESTAGRLHVILMAGDPGIGKTRLLHEVARRAEQVGALVLRGGASQAEGIPPYLPFLEALGSYIRATPPDVPG